MDSNTSCGIRHILRCIFRKGVHRAETRRTGAQNKNSRKKAVKTTIWITNSNIESISHRGMPLHLRHLARENSLAQYLGPNGELALLNTIEVTILSGDQFRELLRQNRNVFFVDMADFDPFTEASASCPIAEESFDSGLLKVATPWFMEDST